MPSLQFKGKVFPNHHLAVPFHELIPVKSRGLSKQASLHDNLIIEGDTNYKRSVFNLCAERAKKRQWSEFVPAMQNKRMRFEVVDEDEWQARLNQLLAAN